ncbi:MAG: hypothetical protein U1E56_00075 [Bauldia sp.]
MSRRPMHSNKEARKPKADAKKKGAAPAAGSTASAFASRPQPKGKKGH